MGLTELLPLLHQLSHDEKRQAMQFLKTELAQEETNLLKPDAVYEIWSPYESVEAADIMLKALQASENDTHA